MPNEGAPGATDTTEGTTQETQGAPAATAGEQGSKAADEKKDEGQKGGDELDGLKANQAQLLKELKAAKAKLKTFEDEQAKREQEDLEKTGQHETLIQKLRAENEQLKSKASQADELLALERDELGKLAKKLKPADAALLGDIEGQTSVKEVRRLQKLAQRLIGESTTKPEEKPPVKDAAPSVTAANGTSVKPASELSLQERVERERQRMAGKGGGFSILGH